MSTFSGPVSVELGTYSGAAEGLWLFDYSVNPYLIWHGGPAAQIVGGKSIGDEVAGQVRQQAPDASFVLVIAVAAGSALAASLQQALSGDPKLGNGSFTADSGSESVDFDLDGIVVLLKTPAGSGAVAFGFTLTSYEQID